MGQSKLNNIVARGFLRSSGSDHLNYALDRGGQLNHQTAIMPSNHTYRKLRIFVACPGDVAAEKDRLVKVVDRLQKPADEAEYFLELKEWRQIIGMGRPQQVIFDHAEPKTWDIFIGVLWQRFGSPQKQSTQQKVYRSNLEPTRNS